MSESETPSRRRVDAAGDTLRRHRLGEAVDADDLAAALEVLRRFRRRWGEEAGLLSRTADELRATAVTVCGADVSVSRRLKREDRIIDKLVRLPSLALSRIQDIGGCRAIVPDLAAGGALRAAIRLRWGTAIQREYDYVASPKGDGYRAVHLVVERESIPVELQIRTRLQHAWARTVEQLEYKSSAAIRGGVGDPALQLALRTLSAALAEQESAHPGGAGDVSDRVAASNWSPGSSVERAFRLIERAC